MKKETELEERLRLVEKEVGLLGDDLERVKLDIKEAIDALRIEVESLKTMLKESIPDFSERFLKIKDSTLREIDPEWLAKKSK